MTKRKKEAYKKTKIKGRELYPESLMMSYGYNPAWSMGALKSPIFQTSTFVFETAEEGKAFFELAYGLREREPNEKLGLIYSRLNNPDLEILEDRLVLWDKAESCAVFESGMAAISTTILEILRPGQAVVYSEPIYGGTDYFMKNILPKFGIETYGFTAPGSRTSIENVIRTNNLKDKLAMIYIETPANPTNSLIDIAMCASVAKSYSTAEKPVYTTVDNTFLGPLWQNPLKHGADLIIYSATKFIGGHSDVIAGACLGSAELITRIKTMRTFMGNMGGPWSGWLLMRSLETLKLRMTSQMKNARYVADFLTDHPKVEKVYYLGHLEEDHPEYKTYRKQCSAPGSMISFDIIGGEKAAFKLLNSMQLFKLAVSLGSTESLAEHPASMTHSDIPPEDQVTYGITEKMVRLSIGVEHPQDLIADLEQALEKV
jgi:methionine-gamma-lyase